MRRDSKLVRGIVDWLLGGVSARLDFVEQDVGSLRRGQQQLEQNQQALAGQVQTHHRQLQQQAEDMIAIKKMRTLLADRLNSEFPGRLCEVCGSPLIFRRVPQEQAYSLRCPNECGKALILPEKMLLHTFRQIPSGS